LNAINAATLRELQSVIDTIKADDSIRVAILTGSGEKPLPPAPIFKNSPRSAAAKVANLPCAARLSCAPLKPAASPSSPASTDLLSAAVANRPRCTLRIASEHARMGQPEVKLGLIPGYGGTQRLTAWSAKASPCK